MFHVGAAIEGPGLAAVARDTDDRSTALKKLQWNLHSLLPALEAVRHSRPQVVSKL